MDAFDQIITDHADMIRRIASSHERDRALVDDLTQDALLAVWGAWPSFRGEGSQRAFVARITHNVCISHVRRAVRRRSEPLSEAHPDDDADPEAAADRSLQRARLLEAVQSLPGPLRDVIVLHLEGFSQAEVADSLGLSLSNAGVRLSRARAALKTLMKADRHDR